MARGLLFLLNTMQIPYDLEFVENRPTVRVQAVALRKPFPTWRSERPKDAFDVLLSWVHRLLRRFETRQ
jgi:hypothetical protein